MHQISVFLVVLVWLNSSGVVFFFSANIKHLIKIQILERVCHENLIVLVHLAVKLLVQILTLTLEVILIFSRFSCAMCILSANPSRMVIAHTHTAFNETSHFVDVPQCLLVAPVSEYFCGLHLMLQRVLRFKSLYLFIYV